MSSSTCRYKVFAPLSFHFVAAKLKYHLLLSQSVTYGLVVSLWCDDKLFLLPYLAEKKTFRQTSRGRRGLHQIQQFRLCTESEFLPNNSTEILIVILNKACVFVSALPAHGPLSSSFPMWDFICLTSLWVLLCTNLFFSPWVFAQEM